MKNKILIGLAFIFVFLGGIVLGFYARNQTVKPLAIFPKSVEKLFSSFIGEIEKEDDDLLYYDTNLSTFIVSGSKKTKVAVVGNVARISHEPDGDYHVIISDKLDLFLVTEFIPEIKLPLPKVGDQIKIWGIVRFDEFHNWWEIHPVIGWGKA